MPRYYPNTRFSDCWGSTGSVTFYHQDGKCYWKNKPNPTFPGSAAQLQQLGVHRRALTAWKSLDNDVKEVWRSLAVVVHAHRPPFLNENHISGYNLSVSAYHGFAVLGEERIPEPQPFTPFPDFFASFHSAEMSGEALRLNFKLSMYGTAAPERYRLLCKVQVTQVGKGSNPSKMRNHLAEPVGEDVAAISVVVPTDIVRESEVQLHVRYLLIDTVTGYRSNYRKLSFVAPVVT